MITFLFFSLLSPKIQGEAAAAAPVRYYITAAVAGNGGTTAVLEGAAGPPRYQGMVGTVMTIARQEGPK